MGASASIDQAQAEKLATMFAENFAQYDPFVGDEVRAAAPGKVA